MSSSDCLGFYRNSVIKADEYIQRAFILGENETYIYDSDYRCFIVNASILKFYIAWETFLESIFECFICGNPTIDGNEVHRCVIPRNEDHAKKMLIGSNKYFDWANPELVRKLSKLYLDDINPIETAVSTIQADLLSLKTIRNAAAHLSTTTQTQIDSLASRLLNRNISNTNPADLLLSVKPGESYTFWEYYKQVLDIAAENIAYGRVV